jgi:RimJ/RimL family protein N-acetyltransferase
MEITFEKSRAEDAQRLLEIQIRAFHEDARIYPNVEKGGPPGYDSLEVMLQDITEFTCHTIRADGNIVGGIVLWDEAQDHKHLHIIHIDPVFHGRGIGTKAMQFIEATYPAKKWTLDTPAYATRNHHFYEKLGFVKVGEIPESDDLLLYSYEKRTDK